MFEERIAAGSPPVMTPTIEPASVLEQAVFSHFTAPDQYDSGSPPAKTLEWALIESYIAGAREHIERVLNWAMITQHWRLTLDRFPGFPINVTGISQLLPSVPYYMPFYEPSYYQVDPSNSSIDLLRPPVQSVEAITYIDPGGNEQTFDPSLYALRANKISLNVGNFWPVTAATPDCVAIEYTTGFGDDPTAVPDRLKIAVKFLAGHWYDNRVPVGTGPSPDVALTLRAILSGFARYHIPR